MPVPTRFSNKLATGVNPQLRRNAASGFSDSLDWFENTLRNQSADLGEDDDPIPQSDIADDNLQINASNFSRRVTLKTNAPLGKKILVLNRLYASEAQLLETANFDAICSSLERHTSNEDSAEFEDSCTFNAAFSASEKVEHMKGLHVLVRHKTDLVSKYDTLVREVAESDDVARAAIFVGRDGGLLLEDIFQICQTLNRSEELVLGTVCLAGPASVFHWIWANRKRASQSFQAMATAMNKGEAGQVYRKGFQS